MTTEKAGWRTAARSAMHSMNNGGVDFSTESQSESLNICCIFLLAAQAPGTELCGSALALLLWLSAYPLQGFVGGALLCVVRRACSAGGSQAMGRQPCVTAKPSWNW